MQKTKLLISLIVTITILVAPVSAVVAAPAQQGPGPIAGPVQSITVETDIDTGITTVLVKVSGANDLAQKVRVSQETAVRLGLVTLGADGNPLINNMALGQGIEVDPAVVLADGQANRHPIGSALATFFSDINGLKYYQIMAAHDKGTGFGVIAQALWLTRELEGNSKVFRAILNARETGDYSAFMLDDGTTPDNWGQLRKAILDNGKNGSLGIVMSNKDENEDKDNGDSADPGGNGGEKKDGNGNNDGNGNGNNQEKEKDKEKDNNGNANNGNDQNKDKDKNKDKKE